MMLIICWLFPCLLVHMDVHLSLNFSIRQPVAQHTLRELSTCSIDIRFSAVAVGAATVASQRRGLRKACVAEHKNTDTTLLYKTRACIFAVGMASETFWYILIHIYIYIPILYITIFIYIYICYIYMHLHEPCFRLLSLSPSLSLSLFLCIYIYITGSLYLALFPLDIAPRFRRAPGQLLCVSGPKHSQKIRILDVLGNTRYVPNILAVKTDCSRIGDELYKWNFQLNPQVWDLESNMW